MAAAMAGLIGSPHCAGMCGPFALACGESIPKLIPWHLGRLTTYTVLGAIAGSLGSIVPGPGWIGTLVSTGLMVWFAATLAGMVPEPKLVFPGLSKVSSLLLKGPHARTRFAFGLANGLLPCGLVYAALSIPVAAGNALVGAVAMLAFGLGTVPILSLLGIGVRRLALHSAGRRKILAAGVLVAGLCSIGIREGLIPGVRLHNHTAEMENASPEVVELPDSL